MWLFRCICWFSIRYKVNWIHVVWISKLSFSYSCKFRLYCHFLEFYVNFQLEEHHFITMYIPDTLRLWSFRFQHCWRFHITFSWHTIATVLEPLPLFCSITRSPGQRVPFNCWHSALNIIDAVRPADSFITLQSLEPTYEHTPLLARHKFLR
jgi:hypothetical protein